MNRQEIEGHADDIIAVDHYADALRIVRDIRLATLEEAARAVCPDCRNALALHENMKGRSTRWIHLDEEGDSVPCYASQIHDLIAALKGEGA